MPALVEGWEHVATEPDACAGPADAAGLGWAPVALPVRGGDDADHWFRVRMHAAGPAPVLCLDGLATVCDVFVDGEPVLRGESMFVAHELPLAPGGHELAICARALTPLLAIRRKPRARWRTRVPYDGNLRWIRTTLLGRAPGFAPGPPVVGPWRPVRVEPSPAPRITLRPRLEGADGVLGVVVRAPATSRDDFSGTIPEKSSLDVEVVLGGERAVLDVRDGVAEGELRLAGAAPWWPHTHGAPALHEVVVRAGDHEVVRRVGFRTLAAGPGAGHDVARDGLALQINGVGVFARGAVWTPVPGDELRATLERARDAGLNMVRVVGTASYEAAPFHDLCDELGMLVWQDFMFANMDYPIGDPGLRALVEREARQALAEIAGRPSLAVLCGNSEVEQQVGMLGLDPALGRGELFGELLPGLVAEAGIDVPYVTSAPTGGDQPFRTDRGVANYFGVGGYRRPLEDVRRAEVRFASECLALANVPDGPPAGDDHRAGVPRDVGSEWDFADVRDHYLELLYGVDAETLRRADPARYHALSAAVSGEVMSEVFGEWRRAGSPCGGAIVLWLRDLEPGAGWGLLDHEGRPKPVWHHLRRTLAPAAVWTTDEGLNGVAVHVANDGPDPLSVTLRIALYRDGEVPVGEASESLDLAAHATAQRGVEALLGHFVDAAYAFRFGPPQQDVIVATLERDGAPISQAFRFPAGRPVEPRDAVELGLEADVATVDGATGVTVRTRRVLHGVRLHVPGFTPADDGFSVEPGHERTVLLAPQTLAGSLAGAQLTALNLRGAVAL